MFTLLKNKFRQIFSFWLDNVGLLFVIRLSICISGKYEFFGASSLSNSISLFYSFGFININGDSRFLSFLSALRTFTFFFFFEPVIGTSTYSDVALFPKLSFIWTDIPPSSLCSAFLNSESWNSIGLWSKEPSSSKSEPDSILGTIPELSITGPSIISKSRI